LKLKTIIKKNNYALAAWRSGHCIRLRIKKSYNAAGSLVRFDNKKVFFHLKNTLAYYNAGVVVVNLEVVGLGPGLESVQGIKFLGKQSSAVVYT
jgi:hypothetical protein